MHQVVVRREQATTTISPHPTHTTHTHTHTTTHTHRGGRQEREIEKVTNVLEQINIYYMLGVWVFQYLDVDDW